MTTTGDRRRSWSLEERGGKGLFTRELELALEEERADLAVHSAKDLPTELPPALALAGFLPREDPRDVLVVRAGVDVPRRIATGSPRRREQAALLFPEAVFGEFRGNVGTRLRKLAEGEADATLLARAGLNRLGIASWPGLVFRTLDIEASVPAAGQGAIALQCRLSQAEHYSGVGDRVTGRAVRIERAFLNGLGGGCHSALAVHFDGVRLHAFMPGKGRKSWPHPKGGEAVEQAWLEACRKELLA